MRLLAAAAAVVGSVACGGSDKSDTASDSVMRAGTIEVLAAVHASTSPVPSRSSPPPIPPTTVAPTYTLPPPAASLPQPVAPPPDDGTTEPVAVLGSIAIPVIGVDRLLYEGIRLSTFDLGPGHWPGTAMPGQIGNMVVGGHRTSANADFRDLDQLEPGAEVVVTDLTGAVYVYIVDQIEITDPFAMRVVYQTPERTATLFACHPPGSTAQRIVVHLTLAN